MDHLIVQLLNRQFEQRREKNRQAEEAHMLEIRKKQPAIAALTDARREAVFGGISGIIRHERPQDLRQRVEEMNLKIRTLLVQSGYPENYLEPIYDCPACRDTGLVGDGLQKPCACYLRAYAALAAQNGAEPEATFENFDDTRFPDEVLQERPDITQRFYMNWLRERCADFADQYPGQKIRNALLYGNSGLGKTYLCKCILDRVSRRGIRCEYVTAPQLLRDLRKSYFEPASEADEAYSETALLIIDDLGTEPLFEKLTVELINELIDSRLSKGLGTVISTNLSLTELKNRYTERFTSRMLSPYTTLKLPFYGRDIRRYVRTDD